MRNDDARYRLSASEVNSTIQSEARNQNSFLACEVVIVLGIPV